MREKDVHNLIEQQDPEAKQRIWNKICSQVDVPVAPQQKATVRKTPFRWAALAAALLCVITLSIVLPLTLRDSEPKFRFCDSKQYAVVSLGQSLKDYCAANGKDLLYIDWYDIAEDRITEYAYINGDKSDIVYLEEFLVNEETGEELMLSITDINTRVDKFVTYYNGQNELTVQGVKVNWKKFNPFILAVFEYENHNYFLQLRFVEGEERIAEILEEILK